MTDWKDLGVPPRSHQPPIHFGGAQLPELQLSPADLVGEHRGSGYEEVPLHRNEAKTQAAYAAMRAANGAGPAPKPSYIDARPGPAGEGSPMARLLSVSRWAVAARIRQGAPLAELLGHIQTLTLLEEQLLSLRERA